MRYVQSDEDTLAQASEPADLPRHSSAGLPSAVVLAVGATGRSRVDCERRGCQPSTARAGGGSCLFGAVGFRQGAVLVCCRPPKKFIGALRALWTASDDPAAGPSPAC